MVDQGIDFLCFVGVNHDARAFVRQQQILVLVDDGKPWLEQGEKHVFFRGLVKELVVDI